MKRYLATALFALGVMPALPVTEAKAQTEPFVGSITYFAGNFAPRGWAFCDGQLLAISSNDALFSILGTIYGGDGRTTFGLPDMRGRLPVHAGTGPGLSTYRLGQKYGVEQVTLTLPQIPSHSHAPQLKATTSVADGTSPSGAALAESASDLYLEEGGTLNATMQAGSVTESPAGGSQSHTNIMPYQGVNCIISLFGVYPSRN